MFLKITAALRSLVPHYLWRQILILRRCLIGRLINQPIIELVGLHWQGGTSNNSSRAYLLNSFDGLLAKTGVGPLSKVPETIPTPCC